ncbi:MULTISPECIES: 4-hydroxy-tetrahydrodipicolinate synthase [Methanothermobacter]|jgi:4-hydroxy-tetrahydrodipicolinate synthase|uniref:4-hydroxy-tetrahydrodipicolinate synthase n=1 Tax=Methanothermobacter thermautotrophicus TaxID=145262 RepID=A0A7J4MWA3_METTF|nr:MULTISPECIES: 4-hydroxy-tetrahydrodipicolinate synthase [Methanothermobacter]MDK2874406.1 4-hydroxy-tetrahydrodipicolinate synthase [Methanothermobacter sp.]MDI6818979.1 4-hydroxy-tetrahydrodipicolinate synthase [Methanothermobacter thermautotrophicus]MDN5373490.1 4-hydroxy-tetrahydrodipicolinate synthase [Methanothermobacter sp.]WBF07022.1 4-hydroxy-tetrahydrodipicolinate synthase [Methanothermobacter thermautotrophicus]WBF08821.1 4-hydroxy-tetrahydrodipicolinate synthase [Methanothermobac
MKIEGTVVAMVTPFTEDDVVDEAGLRENINYLIENGVDGLLVAGTTGESATITHEEQRRMIDILVDEVNGRVRTVAGAGSNSSREAMGLVEYAEDAGADAALVITPYYNKPQPHGLIEHYTMLEEAADIPLIIYNVPSRTGTDIDVDTVAELAKLDGIIGIKEASPDLDKVSMLRSRLMDLGLDDFTVLSGNDNLTLPMISMGAEGVISVVANVDPARMSRLVNEALSGDFESAMKTHYELYSLMKVLFIESNPVPVKEALNMMGRPAGHVRMPLAPLQDANRERLMMVLEELALI